MLLKLRAEIVNSVTKVAIESEWFGTFQNDKLDLEMVAIGRDQNRTMDRNLITPRFHLPNINVTVLITSDICHSDNRGRPEAACHQSDGLRHTPETQTHLGVMPLRNTLPQTYRSVLKPQIRADQGTLLAPEPAQLTLMWRDRRGTPQPEEMTGRKWDQCDTVLSIPGCIPLLQTQLTIQLRKRVEKGRWSG